MPPKKGASFGKSSDAKRKQTQRTVNLLVNVRKQIKIAVAVASSGIAATLLPGGRTPHSTFKLPLDLATNDEAVCKITTKILAWERFLKYVNL